MYLRVLPDVGRMERMKQVVGKEINERTVFKCRVFVHHVH
jgi:hypothetical protein